MANRINLYPLIRKIHLYTGLSLMGFVFMYFVTGWIMTHYDWFVSEKAEPVEQTYEFRKPEGMSLRELAFHIRDTFDINGKVEIPDKQTDSTFRFETIRPGIEHHISVSLHQNKVVIKRLPGNFRQANVVFHRLHGYGGGWLYDLYALMLDLASLSMIVFVSTGIYLWLKLVTQKWLGWTILGGSLLYTFGVMWQLMA